MEILGFILSALVLLYLTFACAAMPFRAGLGGGLKGWEVWGWLAGCGFVLFLWWLLFVNSPFSLSVNV